MSTVITSPSCSNSFHYDRALHTTLLMDAALRLVLPYYVNMYVCFECHPHVKCEVYSGLK